MASTGMDGAAALARRLMDVVRDQPAVARGDHWGDALLAGAMARAGAAAGDEQAVAYAHEWYTATAPGIALTDHCSTWVSLLVARELDQAGALDITSDPTAAAVADHVLSLIGSGGPIPVAGPSQRPWLFTDTVWFAVCPLAYLGARRQDERLMARMLEQAEIHASNLVDEAGGVDHGAEIGGTGRTLGHWTRSTAYMALGLQETLAVLGPVGDDSPAVSAHRSILRDAQSRQRDNGLWLTVIDDDRSPEEVSGSAFLAAALAASADGESDSADRAVAAVAAHVTAQGDVERVAAEVPIEGVDDYRTVAFGAYPWGSAAALLLSANLLSPARESGAAAPTS
jgi:rhamnogalacturonyl hydrolase YesR